MTSGIRLARADDIPALISLWELLFEADAPAWQVNTRDWFSAVDPTMTRIPVVEVEGQVVAAAVGTIETGVPNPHSPTGRAVRLANVVTLPPHRGRGYATQLVSDVIAWSESVGADRVDLSATPDGQRIYQRLGFVLTSAPRLKLVLG